jgi:hypothetical protein
MEKVLKILNKEKGVEGKKRCAKGFTFLHTSPAIEDNKLFF